MRKIWYVLIIVLALSGTACSIGDTVDTPMGKVRYNGMIEVSPGLWTPWFEILGN